jgi:hypothetical protein
MRGLPDIGEEMAKLRHSIASARETGDEPDPHERTRLRGLESIQRRLGLADRVAAVPSMSVSQVSAEMKRLQDADGTLPDGPARAEFRTRMEPLTDALHKRLANLNPAPDPRIPVPTADSLSKRCAAAKDAFVRLQAHNPIAASAYMARHEWAWIDGSE